MSILGRLCMATSVGRLKKDACCAVSSLLSLVPLTLKSCGGDEGEV